MSDVNFYGVLQMPFELAMSDELSRRQFYSVVQEAVKRLHTLEQPAQEPMAWEVTHMDGSAPPPYIVKHKPFYKNDSRTKVTPLYTHPAPSWQGLSDDEIHNLMIGKNGVYYNFARAIEQALKEKNT